VATIAFRFAFIFCVMCSRFISNELPDTYLSSLAYRIISDG